MAANMVKVYYIGPKKQKVDNVSSAKNRRQRVWNGFGTSVMVPEAEAVELLRYDAVWGDQEAFEKAKATRRRADDTRQRAMQARADRMRVRADAGDLSQEDDVEREENLDDDGLSERNEGGPAKGAQEEGEDQQDREMIVQAAVLSLDPENLEDYTAQGTPRVARISAVVGTNVSAEEIDEAVKRLRADGKLK